MKSLRVVPIGMALWLTACGTSPADLAVAACQSAIAERLTGKSYTLAEADLKAGYKALDSGLAELTAPVYFDKGLPGERRQDVTCRVQAGASADAPPSVVGLTFQW
jgi:hypothetical protein